VTPGGILPARELLADMLREMGRPKEALAEYEASLGSAPNRFNGLFGAARSAELSGDSRKAGELYAKLLDNCGTRAADRMEVKHARDFVAQRK
jgi:tetratricopeptide (TPR) repeat protein